MFTVLLIAILAALFYFSEKISFFSVKTEKKEKPAIEKAKELDIQSFSLEGTVTKVLKDSFSVTVSLVAKGQAGNKVSYQEKNIKVSGDTQFNFISRIGPGVEISSASFSDIKKNLTVVIHTIEYPYDLKEVMASKVDITK